jgi:hypothetical protein
MLRSTGDGQQDAVEIVDLDSAALLFSHVDLINEPAVVYNPFACDG